MPKNLVVERANPGPFQSSQDAFTHFMNMFHVHGPTKGGLALSII